MMVMFLHFLGVLTVAVLVQAQDQSGFISIDCGLPEKSSYTEKNTSINYISDAKFIDAGVSKSISPEEKIHHQQQLAHVRSFPSGVRNCYRINVTSGTKYLIRASFYYGNYDDLNEVPTFDLHLGANFWETVKTPFISAIELRILNNDTYNTHSTDETLAIFGRYNFGTNHNKVYRYKDDVYDRLWGIDPFKFWKQLNTSLGPDDLGQNKYKPPAVVMSTAATPINGSAPLEFSWDSDNVNEKYYIYMHFNEVEKLATNKTRAFDIYVNGKLWYDYGPLVPLYQITTTVLSTSALTGATSYLFSLSKTQNSTLPPIINAAEIYTVKDFSQSETEQDDVDAITNIKKGYGVARNWQGDPCAPVAYMWEGLNCSFDDNNPPRITSLNLSSSGLTEQIAASISKLTMLEYLDLSNNSLTGPVPDFLTQLQSLKVLNSGKNNLTGLVPSGLIDRSKQGSLSLSMEQNPNLCESTSYNQQIDDHKNKKNIAIPIVASVAGILVLLVIVAAAIICGVGAELSHFQSTIATGSNTG
ncbi:Malectin-like carbohydrate-binding domain [Sesbania bispinosa]|nr:Malectin-like carbohydrate-binding domain [Sesbania bispinosa]